MRGEHAGEILLLLLGERRIKQRGERFGVVRQGDLPRSRHKNGNRVPRRREIGGKAVGRGDLNLGGDRFHVPDLTTNALAAPFFGGT